jgi:hypothetical protein
MKPTTIRRYVSFFFFFVVASLSVVLMGQLPVHAVAIKSFTITNNTGVTANDLFVTFSTDAADPTDAKVAKNNSATMLDDKGKQQGTLTDITRFGTRSLRYRTPNPANAVIVDKGSAKIQVVFSDQAGTVDTTVDPNFGPRTFFTKDNTQIAGNIAVASANEGLQRNATGTVLLTLLDPFGSGMFLFLDNFEIWTGISESQALDLDTIFMTTPNVTHGLITLAPGGADSIEVGSSPLGTFVLARYDFASGPTSDIGAAIPSGQFVFEAQAVPEPSSILLLGFGIAILSIATPRRAMVALLRRFETKNRSV